MIRDGEDPAVLVMGDGAVFATTFRGLVRGANGGCDWSYPDPALEGTYVVDSTGVAGAPSSAFVVTSAGSDAKVEWLRNVIKVDHAFNYRTANIESALRAACPKGIDVLLENASPEHLCACLPLMNLQKQVLIAGFVGTYNLSNKIGLPENFEYVLDRFLTIQSYPFMDSLDRYDEFVANMIG